jgi:Na+-transporting methylmalonyl-CoA/oxaloacetate decarboxylase gamma subunit
MIESLRSIFGQNFLNPEPETLLACLEVMVLGLGGVFLVLILFYIITKLMVKISNNILADKGAE